MGLPGVEAILARAGRENFPVAMRVLPAALRGQLMAIYGYARLVDDLGDELEPPSARPAALRWAGEELERAVAGRAEHPLFEALGRAVREAGLPVQPLRDLLAANWADQELGEVASWEALLASCALSANPVGRLVLAVFQAATPERVGWSDEVCTGLQVVEHLQDVGEDARRGRVYLAAEDRRRWGCTVLDLQAERASEALRRLVADYARRARGLLGAAVPLCASLGWPAKVAVAGFAAGGLAALEAIEAAGFDVLGVACRPRPQAVARQAARVLAQAALAVGRPGEGSPWMAAARRSAAVGGPAARAVSGTLVAQGGRA
ncbi:squalene synthase HpnC [Aciditerrimonas ferrireducens]|uniref:squalene synthase HpnC n=1 Tax=Aciditerrimonas ferrireducens TaxID=667306 RepID=UPI002004E26F|nr:squalene synthase HpnC [Aciditerrimonas ferrireducens]MCK4176607.1 squalene synthase HpnC [Aciditerrimonas ferrireducens]